MRILFTVIPAAAHMNPTIPVALSLKERGHEVLYATGLEKVALLKKLNIPSVAILRGRIDDMEQAYAPITNHLKTDNPYSVLIKVNYILNLAMEIMVELEQLAESWKPDIVVADFSTPVGAALALRRQIPWVTTTVMPACIRMTKGTPSHFGGLAIASHLGDELRDSLGHLLIEGVRSGLDLVFRKKLNHIGISINKPEGGDGLCSPYAILGFLPWELQPPRDWPKHFHMIGPVTWSDANKFDREDLSFLKSPGRKILVTMGTHLWQDKYKLFVNLANLLEASPYKFIFTLGGKYELSKFINLSAKNVKFTSYLPYLEAISFVDAVIHHGGTGIICSSIEMESPAVVIPQAFDQPDNAQRVSELGIGIRLNPNQISKKKLFEAIEMLIYQPTYKKQTSALANVIKSNYSPIEEAVNIIEEVGQNQQPIYRNSEVFSCKEWINTCTK